MSIENVRTINPTSFNKINESELFTKYKSSYISAFLDFSLHTFYFLLHCIYYRYLKIVYLVFLLYHF